MEVIIAIAISIATSLGMETNDPMQPGTQESQQTCDGLIVDNDVISHN